MYTRTLTALLLAAVIGASPVPESGLGAGASTKIVDVSSSSYSALIIANPSSSSQASPSGLGDTGSFVTPSNVDLPHPAATLSLNGDLPSLSAVPSQLGASESGGVRVVGQTTTEDGLDGSEAGSESQTEGDQDNSAGRGGKAWMGGMAVAAALSMTAVLA